MPDPLPPEAPVARVTLSRQAIASARALMLAVTGDATRTVIEDAIKEGAGSPYPIGRVLADVELPELSGRHAQGDGRGNFAPASPPAKAHRMNPAVSAVTDRIIERSRPTRSAYLSLIERERDGWIGRPRLGCANLAHAYAGTPEDRDAMKTQAGAMNIGLVTA
ncbi:hypothetical protein LTR94_031997, partial [Friedmanniomyces endolithicus]